MTNLNKIGSKLLAVAVAFLLSTTAGSAQNLVNNATGTVNNAGTGTIQFNDNNGEFQNENATNITNDGVIVFLGTDNLFTGTNPLATAALRVPGLVRYAGAGGTQNVYEGYYTDLEMAAAATKEFAAKTINIFGDYTTAGGTRSYSTSLIIYDGTAAQSVAAENTANAYNNVEFQEAGLKTLTGDADVSGTMLINANTTGGGFAVDGGSADVTVTGNTTQDGGAGDFSINNGGAAHLNGPANDMQALTSVNDGTLTLGDGTNPSVTTINGGTLNLANPNVSLLAVNASATMEVAGTFTNADQARTNMTFDVASTVDYQDGSSPVITTVNSNQYGNFIISNTALSTATASGGSENDVYVAGNFTMNGGANFDLLGSTNGFLAFTDGTKSVTYAGQEEVVGNFRRTHSLSSATDYTYNNAEMKVNFTTAPTSGNYFEIFNNPDGTADQYQDNRDVKRKITLNYDVDGWIAEVQASYTQADVDEDGNWETGYDEDQIRFFEGDASADEKLSTGEAYARTNSGAGSFGHVRLGGVEPTNDAVDGTPDENFFSTNDLILRAGPAIFYSINPGRWSNPDTWDEGVEPPTEAEVVVRHNVHAGFVRATDAYTVPEAQPSAMATKITIQEPNTEFTNPTLMFGKDDTYPASDFATSTTGVPGITDPGRVIVETLGGDPVNIPALNNIDASADDTFLGGLLVFGNADGSGGGNDDGTPAEFQVSENLVNDGVLNIGGVLAIGQ